MAKKVLVAMSGGVDSSVAAYLLKRDGLDVAGMTLKLIENGGKETDNAISDAEQVSFMLGIKHFTADLSKDFSESVINAFIGSYMNGETPNPCIVCNHEIKFGRMLAIAESMGFDCIATGHYARAEYDADSGRWQLKKGLDMGKDQSYVLYTLSQSRLAKTLLPLGTLTKGEVRSIAKKLGLVNANRPESQDICFIPDGDYKAFIERRTGRKSTEGNITDMAGNVLGRHGGAVGYTIGQRRGLGVSAEKPLYVVRKDVRNNTVVLGGEEDLYSDRLMVEDVNFISVPRLDSPMSAGVKIRYSQTEAKAVLWPLPGGRVLVEFDKPQRAATPGQSAVFYEGETVIGGGVIRLQSD